MYKRIAAFIAILVITMLACMPTGGGSDDPPSSGNSNIIFQDDFEDTGSGWEVGDYGSGSVGYEDGYYFVSGTEVSVNMYGAAGVNYSDVSISVEAKPLEGPSNGNNGYGIICRKNTDPSSDNGYYFRISADGYYSISKADENGFTDLTEWTEDSSVNTGNKQNEIVVTCDGSTLSLEINGNVVATVNDSTYSSGDIALVAVTYEDGSSTKVKFDNLVVSKP